MDADSLQGDLAAAMGFSSGEDLKSLLVAIVFACLYFSDHDITITSYLYNTYT